MNQTLRDAYRELKHSLYYANAQGVTRQEITALTGIPWWNLMWWAFLADPRQARGDIRGICQTISDLQNSLNMEWRAYAGRT